MTSDDDTKDLHAARSLANVMHYRIDKPVQSFTSSDRWSKFLNGLTARTHEQLFSVSLFQGQTPL